MIEPMKKITMIVTEKDRNSFLSGLRSVGVVHIRNIQEPESHDIKFIEDRIAKVDSMLRILGPYCASEEKAETTEVCGEKDLISMEQEISELYEEKEDLLSEQAEIEARIAWFSDWGEFDPRDLGALEKKGLKIRLYEISEKDLGKLPEEIQIHIVKTSGKKSFLAVLGGKNGDIPGEEVNPPERSAEEMRMLAGKNEKRIEEIEKELEEKAVFCGALRECRCHLDKEKQFFEVKHGMREEEKVSFLQGYCPEKDLYRLIKLADDNGVGYMIDDADPGEETPTLITNPGWVNIIKPVFQFMNTLPGYDEFDISAIFLAFFSLFFGMLIGDGGYGLIILIFTFLGRKKMSGAPAEPFLLMYLMGGATLVWGALTGNWFGAEAIGMLPGLKGLVIDKINAFDPGSQNFTIYLCFIIGAVHLTIAHMLKIFRFMPSLRALGQVGWVMIVWGMFFGAGTLVVGKPFPVIGGWLLGGGILTALFFTEPEKGVLKGALGTLTDLPLSVIGCFSDVVSYLRLFAVGYASVVLASTFNGMALEGGIKGITGGLFAALILVMGHTLNIVLGMMAVVVHGIRLNMLEFSGHLGMQWSGRKYDPFKE